MYVLTVSYAVALLGVLLVESQTFHVLIPVHRNAVRGDALPELIGEYGLTFADILIVYASVTIFKKSHSTNRCGGPFYNIKGAGCDCPGGFDNY